jgi:hypothetical protein
MSALLADFTAVALYRRALVQRGLRRPFQDVIGEATASASSMIETNSREFALWIRDLFRRQSERPLEAYRLVSVGLIALTVLAVAWWSIV